jgi:hypothetical protein
MKLIPSLLAAAATLAMAASASAYTTSFGFNSTTNTFTFGASQIGAGQSGTDVFTISNGTTGLSEAPLYFYEGDLSGSGLNFMSVMFGATDVSGAPRSTSWGDITSNATVMLPITVTVDWKAKATLPIANSANYQGSVLLAPVPEPETYAMMLAGLGALGFLARRRQQA